MRIIVIGASGTIGREVAKTLAASHEVVTASRSGGVLRVDIADPGSVEALFHDDALNYSCFPRICRSPVVVAADLAGL
jgi:uncharacterized protein YbjT (DUF2867 family)